MKKIVAFLLAVLMMLSAAAFAGSVPMNKEDQMVNMVKGFLDENNYPYEYDD